MTPDDYGLVQIILMIILVSATIFYAYQTKKASDIAKASVDASVKMAEEMRAQRYDTVRPIIDICKQRNDPNELIEEGLAVTCGRLPQTLSCILHNIGLGPAIDVHFNKQQPHDLGTIPVGGKTPKEIHICLESKGNQMALVVHYKDVYGRFFESSRKIGIKKGEIALEVGPLEIRPVEEE